MDVVNRFSGPLVTDIDVADVQPTQLYYPSLNVRIYNKDGQGWIATNVPGNKYNESDQVGFKLTDGFICVGGIEHNGILYLLSWNGTSEVNGVGGIGEIGCFPSPQQVIDAPDYPRIDTTKTGFERIYKPLLILDGANPTGRDWLSLVKLDFGLRMHEVIVKPSYDGSVDLYICNGVTPNLVINSGFTQEGVVTNRSITEEQFDTILKQILPINKIPNLSLNKIKNTGKLRPGNYFVYLKYLDANFNSTVYITSLGPICINFGDDSYGSEGLQEKDWLENTQSYTGKAIELKIDPTTIDSSFKYIKFSIIRYSAFSENGSATTDIYSIDKEYIISSIVANNGLITITGSEDEETSTFNEIIEKGSSFNISESHAIVNKRYFGVNWKSEIDFTDEMSNAFKEFAQLIRCEVDTNTKLADYDYALDGDWNGYGYKNPERVTDKLGYFDGEMYPFAVKFVLSGGSETDPYPIASTDLMFPGNKANTTIAQSEKGIVRMPSEYVISSSPNYVTKIKFLLDAANDYKDSSPHFVNVIGFYFVRGERIDNLITQGLMLRTVNGSWSREFEEITPIYIKKYFDGDEGLVENDAKSIPIYNCKPPIGLGISGIAHVYTAIESDPDNISLTRFGVYSTDHMFSDLDILENTDLYMKPICKIRSNKEYIRNETRPDIYFSLQVKEHTEFLSDRYYTISAYNINQGTTSHSSKFVSLLLDGDGNQGSDEKGFSYHNNYNRSMISPKYIGVTLENGEEITIASHELGLLLDEYYIVNIYREKNSEELFFTKVDLFNHTNEEYSRISQVTTIGGYLSSQIVAGGDNFKQRTYFRQMRFYGYDTDADHIDGDNTIYKHGLLLGFITSSMHNTAMRNEVDYLDSSSNKQTYTYYPKILKDNRDVDDWVLLSDDESDQAEAFQINDGYNKDKNPDITLGYDEDTLVIDPTKQNRAYFSNPLVSGSLVDQFRQIYSTSYKDFLVEDSPIIKVIEYKGRVICVTRNKIFQVYVDDRLVQRNASGDNVIANASNFLNDNVNILEEFGVQHKTAIIQTDRAVYGWDYIRNIIWRIILTSSEAPGSYYLKAEDLTKTKFYQKAIIDLKASTDFSDIVSEPIDNNLEGKGVVLGYNKKYNEVYFTLLKKDVTVRNDTTLIFSEMIDGFTPNRSLNTTLYMKLGEGLYSVKSLLSHSNLSGSEYFYKEDEGLPQTFYDDVKSFQLSFIVNGNSGNQNLSMVTKIFESLKIEMPDTELTSIVYGTEYQTSTYMFNSTDIADMPEYYKQEWLVPVSVQTSIESGQYSEDSELEGKWIKITLTYNPANSAEDIYIRKVISSFTPIL